MPSELENASYICEIEVYLSENKKRVTLLPRNQLHDDIFARLKVMIWPEEILHKPYIENYLLLNYHYTVCNCIG